MREGAPRDRTIRSAAPGRRRADARAFPRPERSAARPRAPSRTELRLRPAFWCGARSRAAPGTTTPYRHTLRRRPTRGRNRPAGARSSRAARRSSHSPGAVRREDRDARAGSAAASPSPGCCTPGSRHHRRSSPAAWSPCNSSWWARRHPARRNGRAPGPWRAPRSPPRAPRVRAIALAPSRRPGARTQPPRPRTDSLRARPGSLRGPPRSCQSPWCRPAPPLRLP